MFTGIIQKIAKVIALKKQEGLLSYALQFDDELQKNLVIGASVSVDGICQTVTKIEGEHVWFDAIEETLERTSLKFLEKGSLFNIERAAKIGDEIGGHLVSGHICCSVTLTSIDKNIYTLTCPPKWLSFIFLKGFVALNGMSLTVCEVNRDKSFFTVHLIPETLKRTTMQYKKIGDLLNLEVDYLVQSFITYKKEVDHGKDLK